MAIEDFTTYTEVDPEGNITVYAAYLDVDNIDRDAQAYVYKDFGAGTFTDIEHLYTVNCQPGDGGALVCFVGIVNTPGTRLTMSGNDDGFFTWYYRSINSWYLIYLRDYESDDSDSHQYPGTSPPPGNWRYLTVERSGNVGTCKIYTDAARTVLEDTLTITAGTQSYRYCSAAMSNGDTPGTKPNDIHCEIHNLNLQLGNPPNAPTNPSPADGSSGASFPTQAIQVDVSDPDADAMDVYFYDASDDSLIGVNIGVASGSSTATDWGSLICNTLYSWYAIADDGTYTTSSATFTFTTDSCPFEFEFPLKEKLDRKSKYRVKDLQRGKYKDAQKNKYKYKRKIQR